jgi:hypothetical protein
LLIEQVEPIRNPFLTLTDELKMQMFCTDITPRPILLLMHEKALATLEDCLKESVLPILRQPSTDKLLPPMLLERVEMEEPSTNADIVLIKRFSPPTSSNPHIDIPEPSLTLLLKLAEEPS